MKSACHFVVLFEARTASEDLRKPELVDGALHVCDFPLGWGGCFYPLRGFAADTADEVGVCEGFRCTRLGFNV